MIKTSVVMLSAFVSAGALAAPVSYTIDPNHTYPSFASIALLNASPVCAAIDKLVSIETGDRQ